MEKKREGTFFSDRDGSRDRDRDRESVLVCPYPRPFTGSGDAAGAAQWLNGIIHTHER
jgi:hypothetical protein